MRHPERREPLPALWGRPQAVPDARFGTCLRHPRGNTGQFRGGDRSGSQQPLPFSAFGPRPCHERTADLYVSTELTLKSCGGADRGYLHVVLRGSAQFDPPPASFSRRNPMWRASAAHSRAAESPG